MKELVPILYTIREADGLYKLRRFLDSVKETNLNSFELIFIAKSNNNCFRDKLSSVVAAFELNFEWKIWSTSDDGFYFSSYRRFLLEHNCNEVILLPSDSVVLHKDWAEILIWPIQSNLAPLCGSMGSWESILENKKTINYISLKKRLSGGVALSTQEAELDYYYNGFSHYSTKPTYLTHPFSKYIYLPFIIRFLSKLILLKQFRISYLLHKSFFRFPNPHVRGTGIAITRDLFLRTVTRDTRSEMDGFKIESGKFSFAYYGEKNYQKNAVIWVGDYVEISDLKVMPTFRWKSDFKPLVIDDHYLDFDSSDAPRRKSLTWITWGV